MRRVHLSLCCLALLSGPSRLGAQWWDLPAETAARLAQESHRKLAVSLEIRGRYEERGGMLFGRDPDLETGLFRTRVGLSYRPIEWLKFSGMLQDSRAPWYGPAAPTTARDSADLHEAYVEVLGESKQGPGFGAGRRMITYGEGRLIGIPQWGNLARTFDHARAWYRTGGSQFEFLYVSPVKIRLDEFNRPVLGDHIYGTYNVLPKVVPGHSVDLYWLRREQNRPGGFTGGSRSAGTDRLSIDTFGFRMTGKLPAGISYSLEGARQTGKMGPAPHRAGAWFSGVARRWKPVGRAFDLSGEYKYASGTGDPVNTSRSGTFDQLYAANHDRFGHEDLFGWRNVHSVRALASYNVWRAITFNLMYDNLWLASARDALYNGQGRAIAQSLAGTAGRHVGQEYDGFVTYRSGHWLLGAGAGYFRKGEFIQRTTPGANVTYLYLFHSYSF